jgi:hypothetical protein
MTELLKEAIEVARQLPEEKQDAVADALFAYLANEAWQGTQAESI